MASSWRTIRVFISSTLRDMHAERDYLRTHVFPELEERLAARRCHLEPVDLRLGVVTDPKADEERRELQILKICLGEIERCRPYMIVLLGDRYGWVPPTDRTVTAAREAGFVGHAAGKSVTALEIEFGLRTDDCQQAQRCFFYFREPLPYEDMPPKLRAEYSDQYSPVPAVRRNARRLAQLKTRIEADEKLSPRVHRYQATWDSDAHRVAGLEEWGKQVLDNLWAEFEGAILVQEESRRVDWLVEEHELVADFAEHSARDFVARDGPRRRLVALATSPRSEWVAWGACVTGPLGSGKSALFSRLLQDLRSCSDVIVLAHAAGLGPRASSVGSMLRRWLRELSNINGEEAHPTGDASDEVAAQRFAGELIRTAEGHRVVILIDALNEFETEMGIAPLAWLPRRWPDNVRLICTSDNARRMTSHVYAGTQGVVVETLGALEPDEARSLTLLILKRYHRSMDEDVLQSLLAKERKDGSLACGNPLWLRMAVEYLNLLDLDDFVRANRDYPGSGEQQLAALMHDLTEQMPSEPEGMSLWILDRAKRHYGPAWTRALVYGIALSRFGWRETDLHILVPRIAALLGKADTPGDWNALRFAAIRRGLRAYLVQRGSLGQWDFTHQTAKNAVACQVLTDIELTGKIHATIANYLDELSPDDVFRQVCLMWHVVGSDNAEHAARCYSREMSPREEHAATVALVGRATWNPDAALSWVLSLPEIPALRSHERARIAGRFLRQLCPELASRVAPDILLRTLRVSKRVLVNLTNLDPTNVDWQRTLVESRILIGLALREEGDLQQASAILWKTLGDLESSITKDDEQSLWREELCRCHFELAELLLQHGDRTASRQEYQASLKLATSGVQQACSNDNIHRIVSLCHLRIGGLLRHESDVDAALSALLASREAAKCAAQLAPTRQNLRILADSQRALGVLLEEKGDLQGALESIVESSDNLEFLRRSDPEDLELRKKCSLTSIDAGILLAKLGRDREARSYLDVPLEIQVGDGRILKAQSRRVYTIRGLKRRAVCFTLGLLVLAVILEVLTGRGAILAVPAVVMGILQLGFAAVVRRRLVEFGWCPYCGSNAIIWRRRTRLCKSCGTYRDE